jgi:hypothetical protein
MLLKSGISYIVETKYRSLIKIPPYWDGYNRGESNWFWKFLIVHASYEWKYHVDSFIMS